MQPQEPPKPPKPSAGTVMAYWSLAQAVTQIAQGTQRVIAEDETIQADSELKKIAYKMMTSMEELQLALVARIPVAREKAELEE